MSRERFTDAQLKSILRTSEKAVFDSLRELVDTYEKLVAMDAQIDPVLERLLDGGYVSSAQMHKQYLEEYKKLLHTDLNGLLRLTSKKLGVNIPDALELSTIYSEKAINGSLLLKHYDDILRCTKQVQAVEIEVKHYADIMERYEDEDEQRVSYLEAQVEWLQLKRRVDGHKIAIIYLLTGQVIKTLQFENSKLVGYLEAYKKH